VETFWWMWGDCGEIKRAESIRFISGHAFSKHKTRGMGAQGLYDGTRFEFEQKAL